MSNRRNKYSFLVQQLHLYMNLVQHILQSTYYFDRNFQFHKFHLYMDFLQQLVMVEEVPLFQFLQLKQWIDKIVEEIALFIENIDLRVLVKLSDRMK